MADVMSLREQLQRDAKDAMKEKDKLRKDAIQMLRSAVLQIEKDKLITLDEEGLVEVLAKELRSRKDALVEIEKGSREDLTENLKREIAIIQAYLPEPISEAELEAIVREAFIETGAQSVKDMGKVMKVVLPKVKGRADGSQINAIVKKLLG
jgi:uncharacterized protein YqeY